MVENTKIEWATHTWNPWMGCTKVSPACDHCYAEELMDTRYGRVRWGAGESRARTSPQTWNGPRKWNLAAQAARRIDTVFCLSLGDIWDSEVDPAWREDAFEVMDHTPNLLYLLLSKRIGNAIRLAQHRTRRNRPLPANVALGATMVNQKEWDRDIPKLRESTRELGARFCFASIEPMLGPIDAGGLLPDWVIVGGESGKDARPIDPEWVRAVRDQCVAVGVPFFFKQWGEWHSDALRYREARVGGLCPPPDMKIGKKRAGRLLDGREWNEMPRIAA